MYESHEEDSSKMFHLPNGLLSGVLCFNPSYPVLNKTPTTLEFGKVNKTHQNTKESQPGGAMWLKNLGTRPEFCYEANSQCSILSVWTWNYIVYQLPLDFITFKYNFSLCHICTTLWKVLNCFVGFLKIFLIVSEAKEIHLPKGVRGNQSWPKHY